MKNSITILFIGGLMVLNASCWKPDLKHAHPNAQKLMTDDFLWSPLEQSSPFGNDDGADAIWEFKEWRKSNKRKSPLIFIKNLLNEWNYTVYDYSQIDTLEIRLFINSSDIGDRLCFGIDDVIIATGFGQFILEGKIDTDLKQLTLIALNRQLNPMLLKYVDKDYREIRIKQLNKLIEIINAA